MSISLTRIFRHPLIIISILLLLVNDHILKFLYPSWLTGKLSDIAGLFFFPFLLAHLLRLFFKPTSLAVRTAFLLTAVIFSILKTTPVVNSALTGWVQAWLGFTPQVRLDATDLFALIMLLPAWMLWKKTEQAEKSTPCRPRRLEIALLGLASLAALASTPCGWDNSLTPLRAQVFGNKVYTGYCQNELDSVFYYGVNAYTRETEWIPERAPKQSLMDMLHLPPVKLPYIACDPLAKTHCYRIDGSPRVEESEDGGQTWRTGWQLPPGREEVVQRLAQLDCGKIPRSGFIDLAILPDPSGSVVVAVTGYEGTLVRQGDGAWQRLPILPDFNVTPDKPTSLEEAALVLPWEILLSEAAALFGYTLLSFIVRWMMPASPAGDGITHPRLPLHPVWFLAAWVLAVLGFSTARDPVYGRFAVSLISIPAAAVMLSIQFILARTTVGDERRAGMAAFLAIATLAILPLLTFISWLYALLPYYTLALVLAIVLPLLVYIACLVRILKLLHQ